MWALEGSSSYGMHSTHGRSAVWGYSSCKPWDPCSEPQMCSVSEAEPDIFLSSPNLCWTGSSWLSLPLGTRVCLDSECVKGLPSATTVVLPIQRKLCVLHELLLDNVGSLRALILVLIPVLVGLTTAAGLSWLGYWVAQSGNTRVWGWEVAQKMEGSQTQALTRAQTHGLSPWFHPTHLQNKSKEKSNFGVVAVKH